MPNSHNIEHRIYTMCMMQRNNEVSLIKRPDHRGFPGYIAPGGKVDFPESIVQAAKREVKEETGLLVSTLTFKGLDEYVNPKKMFDIWYLTIGQIHLKVNSFRILLKANYYGYQSIQH